MFDRQLVVFKMQFGDTLMAFVYEEGRDLHHDEAGIIAKSVRRQSPYRIPRHASLLSSGSQYCFSFGGPTIFVYNIPYPHSHQPVSPLLFMGLQVVVLAIF
jgi:hypothetical protein